MALVVGAAVGLTALRSANVFWASAIATLVVVVVATSVMGALALRGRERYAWAGFAVFSGVYLAVAMGTVVSNGFKEYFGPTVALEHIQSKVSGDRADPLLGERASLLRRMAVLQQTVDEQNRHQWAMAKARLAALDALLAQGRASGDSADRWRSWLPGAVNAGEFRCVGHGLFALLSVLIGSVIGRMLYARRERGATSTP